MEMPTIRVAYALAHAQLRSRTHARIPARGLAPTRMVACVQWKRIPMEDLPVSDQTATMFRALHYAYGITTMEAGARVRASLPDSVSPQLQPGNAHLSVSGSCVRLHAYVVASSQARVPMVCVRASYGDAQVPICDLNGNRLFTLVMATPGRKTVRI